MESSSGLSRRRVGGNSTLTTTTLIDDEDRSVPVSRSGSSTGTTGSPPSTTRVAHAGSAFEGGAKIAVDPHDLEKEGEDMRNGGKLPKLTIMEEVLLLGLKDRQVGLSYLLFSIIQQEYRAIYPSGMTIYHMHTMHGVGSVPMLIA